jgi:tRNA G18 (ribose-2'-O)-methylase SpoU
MKALNKKEIKKLVNKESKRDLTIYLLLENIEYARNVASLFRTADAAGVKKIILTGISKTPPFGKEMKQVSRNTEESIPWVYEETSGKAIQTLKKQGFYIIAVELADKAFPFSQIKEKLSGKNKICILLGSEVYGVKNSTLEKCDSSTYIPMYGKGASLNVANAGTVILFSI